MIGNVAGRPPSGMPKDTSIKSVLPIGSGPIPDTTPWFQDHRPVFAFAKPSVKPANSVGHILLIPGTHA